MVPGGLVVPSASCGFELHWGSLVVPGGSRWSWWFLVIYCGPFHSWWFLVIPSWFLVLGHSGSWLVLFNFSGVFLEYKQCARAGGIGREYVLSFALFKHNLKGLFHLMIWLLMKYIVSFRLK